MEDVDKEVDQLLIGGMLQKVRKKWSEVGNKAASSKEVLAMSRVLQLCNTEARLELR